MKVCINKRQAHTEFLEEINLAKEEEEEVEQGQDVIGGSAGVIEPPQEK